MSGKNTSSRSWFALIHLLIHLPWFPFDQVKEQTIFISLFRNEIWKMFFPKQFGNTFFYYFEFCQNEIIQFCWKSSQCIFIYTGYEYIIIQFPNMHQDAHKIPPPELRHSYNSPTWDRTLVQLFHLSEDNHIILSPDIRHLYNSPTWYMTLVLFNHLCPPESKHTCN